MQPLTKLEKKSPNVVFILDITNQIELLRAYSSDIFERQILEIEDDEE